MHIHVTQTQKLIAETALASIGIEAELIDQMRLDDLVKAMLVIEQGGMQPYFLQGFRRSCMSRGPREPERVADDCEALFASVDVFHRYVDEAKGEAARRIRGNRARRIREIEREAEALREQADLRRVLLRGRRNGRRMLGDGRGPGKLQVVAV